MTMEFMNKKKIPNEPVKSFFKVIIWNLNTNDAEDIYFVREKSGWDNVTDDR